MFGVIYKITNLVNGKIYVGQTKKSLKERFQEHSCTDYPIGRGIRKYGKENFTIEPLEECETREQLNECEIFWIAELKSKSPNGYNLTDSGDGVSGCIFTDESKAKMSLSHRGQTAWNKGIKASAESRAKMSAAQKRRFKNPAEREKISKSIKNLPPEVLKKMGEHFNGHEVWNKGKTLSEEHKQHLSESHKGKTLPPEQRAKISASNKARWARIKAEREQNAVR